MTNMNETNTTTMAPENAKYDDKVIKKIIASALLNVDGFLGTTNGLVGSITAFVQKNTNAEEDVIKGISADVKDHEVDVTVKAITEAGKNIPEIVNHMTTAVTEALRDVGGLNTKAVNVEVVDTMTKAEYEEKYVKNSKEKEESK